MLMSFLLFCPAFLVCAAHATDGFTSLSSSGLVFFFSLPIIDLVEKNKFLNRKYVGRSWML